MLDYQLGKSITKNKNKHKYLYGNCLKSRGNLKANFTKIRHYSLRTWDIYTGVP